MTKEKFIKRLEDKFRAMIADVERLALAEIEGHRARMEAQTLADWLRSEIEQANAEPALKYFDMVLRPSYSTPEDAARSLADDLETRFGRYRTPQTRKVHFDPTRVNWPEIWERLKPYFEPQSRRIYHYVPRPFSEYKAAAKAEARAKIFATAANKGTTDTATPRQQPPKEEPPAFSDLFVSAEAMEKALQAARGIDPPMIYANDQWTGNYNQNPGLRAFFEFCNDKDYLKKPTNKTSAIQAFAFYFTGKEAGKNAPSAMPDSKLKGKLILFDRS